MKDARSLGSSHSAESAEGILLELPLSLADSLPATKYTRMGPASSGPMGWSLKRCFGCELMPRVGRSSNCWVRAPASAGISDWGANVNVNVTGRLTSDQAEAVPHCR